MKKNPLTAEQHNEMANDLAIAAFYVNKVFNRCQKHYPKSHRIVQLLKKIVPGNINGEFTKIQSELDSLYHASATEADYKAYGHVYYDLDERYSEITRDDIS